MSAPLNGGSDAETIKATATKSGYVTPAKRRLPRGCWQAFCWYASATLMTLAHHGFNGGHASPFVGAWFAGVAAMYALSFIAGALEQRHG